MSDLAISNDGTGYDLTMVDGDFVLLSETEDDDGDAVAQRLVYAYMTWQGESVYDTAAGVPYLDGVFGTGPVPGIGAYLTQIGLDVDGVETLAEDPTFTLGSDRELAIGLAVLTTAGLLRRLNLEINPL